MNSITIAGNLGKDAEVRNMPDGTAVAQFSVADSQGREKPTVWWNCQLFGKRAQSLAPYLLKGGQVTVTGNVTQREWTDKDGTPRKSMEVRVNDVALQGGSREGHSATKTPDGQTGQARSKPSTGFDDMPDDVPF
jgi:single-strand DNA-binding protein